MLNKETIVIAIDPGYDRLGLAILDKNKLIFSDCITTQKTGPFEKRLLLVGEKVEVLVKKYRPTHLAIEDLFFSSNQKTAMKVSMVGGMISFIALKNGLEIKKYTPAQIKVAITGHGRADKGQVSDMVKRLIKIKKNIKYDDELDAIATGLAFFAIEKFLL
jgi:crossover junction endodeoxyribonuclease RuvC